MGVPQAGAAVMQGEGEIVLSRLSCEGTLLIISLYATSAKRPRRSCSKSLGDDAMILDSESFLDLDLARGPRDRNWDWVR